jgi:hypothetical protein
MLFLANVMSTNVTLLLYTDKETDTDTDTGL